MQYLKFVVIGLVVLGAFFGLWKISQMEEPEVKKETILEITADDWIEGNPAAKAVLIEYLDFECPACGAYYPLVKKLRSEFSSEDLVIVTRYFPLPGHVNGLPSALAAEAAGKQGKFFEMRDMLFEKQTEWGGKRLSGQTLFAPYATAIGLDIDRFNTDRGSDATKERVSRDRDNGLSIGVNSTPTFFLNGEKLQNPRSYEDFKMLVGAAILKGRPSQNTDTSLEEHAHADFRVYINGKALDFTLSKYQSTEDTSLHPYMHLHGGIGTIIHKHQKGVTLGDFFESLGIRFTKDCFVMDDGKELCNGEGETLKFFVNGVPNAAFGDYELNDLDKILITFGDEEDVIIQAQTKSVTDDACIYSEKCPERGPAPIEECVGGLGTGCE